MKNPEHRVQTTKRLLREALTGLLTEKPLQSITVKELCARAHLNRGTFYAHYADVYDLMEQIESELRTEFFAAVEASVLAEGTLSPPTMAKRIFECIEHNADLCRVVIGPYGDKAFAQRLLRESREKVLERCLQTFPNADRWKIEAYFTFITGGCYALMSRWLRGDIDQTSETLAGGAEQIMDKGIGFLQ